MMKIRRSPNAFTVYTDALLFLFMWAMMLVTVLFIISHVQAKKNEDFHPKAEYLITLTWEDTANIDLDLWLKPPNGQPVFYQNRETKNISLDRDSRGYITNQSVLETGQVINSGNREIIAIRAILPGDYVAAITYYAGEGKDNLQFPIGKEVPGAKIKATIRIEKVNPTVTTVWLGDVDMTFVKQIKTVVSFHINDDGSVKVLPLPEERFLEQGGYGDNFSGSPN